MSTTPTNDGGPAFPKQGQHVNFGDGWLPAQDGMSLRDYFAANADVSIYAPADAFVKAHGRMPTIQELADYIAQIRLIEADAMLAARNQTTT